MFRTIISLTIAAALHLLLHSCSDKKIVFQQNIPSVASLDQHSEIFEKRIEKISENVYVAIGYGLANSMMIEGKDSIIIIDCMESIATGKAVKQAFDSISNKPVKAIIYTHNHTDHIFGASAFAENYLPDVYAHETFSQHLYQTVALVRNITEQRAYRMFGVYLDEHALVNCGIGPQLNFSENTELGVVAPNITFSDSLKVTVAGIDLILFHAPGETPDQLFVWMPQEKILFCGDNVYKAFPNLYTIRGTPYRDINLWKSSIDKMRYLQPEILVPSHTIPLFGTKEIQNVLTDYRDAIQFVHDQTVRGMNLGLSPDELAEQIILPAHLQQSPWLQEFYGKVEWSVRSVYDGYLGFFDGNPSNLLPLKKQERAQKMEALAGGKISFSEKIKTAFSNHEYQWTLELTDHFLQLYPEDDEAKQLRIDALLKLAAQQSNPNARNYYLTCALELQGMKNKRMTIPSQSMAHEIPLSVMFNGLAARLNYEKSIDINQLVLFEFTDTGEQWSVHVRKGIAEVQPFIIGTPEITIRVSSKVWKELGAKLRKPLSAYLSGDIKADGGQLAFLSFLRLFDMEE